MRIPVMFLLAVCTLLTLPARGAGQSNDRLVKEVRHELIMLPYYGVFDNLAFRVDGGKVTLFGQVTRPVLKSDAGNVVKKIEGVQTVDNEIEVLPPSPMDDRLRLELYRAIFSKAPLQQYQIRSVPPIHIIVKSGNVSLEGVVSSQADKDVAGIAAKTVPGIFGVTNNLKVEK